MLKALIIEDDLDTANEIYFLLVEHNFEAFIERDGAFALKRVLSESFDVITLDRMLPGLDGIAIIESIRAENIKTPVLLLSALGMVDDRVRGLKAGGDDYLVKPFAPDELVARVEALMRRQDQNNAQHTLIYGDLELNLLTREATRSGQQIDLVAKEFKLLEYLVRYSGQVLTKKMILESLWNINFDPSTNFIEVHIARLRKKVDQPGLKQLIHTVRGVGYTLESKQ
jgi:two-component system OmpR family response regulator